MIINKKIDKKEKEIQKCNIFEINKAIILEPLGFGVL